MAKLPYKIDREQAEEFISTLWPCGHMSHLDNPTRTFIAAHVGHVPHALSYSRTDPSPKKLGMIAALLRDVATHIEVATEDADRAALTRHEREGIANG